MRFWVYDRPDLLRTFATLEEAEHFCKGTDFRIVKQPRVVKRKDFTGFEEAPF